MLPSFIHFYDEGTAKTLDVKAIADYLRGNLPSDITVDEREEFCRWHLSRLPEDERKESVDVLARRLASIKVRDPGRQELSTNPIL